MALIFDTNALSAFADGDPALGRMIELEPDLALPTVVLGEHLFRTRQSRFRARYEVWLHSHLRLFLVLSAGTETAGRYAEIRSELKALRRPIPTNDLWIAALSREHGYTLVSRDIHFDAVPALKRIAW
jgi:tRNA(fMet)-specific endonuclease VapC